MAEITEEQITQAVENIKELFKDGFQFSDIAGLIKEVMTFTKAFTLTGPEKKELAMRVTKRVLDETDIPWVPDQLSLPLVGEIGADALILSGVDKLIDLIWSAEKGELELGAS